jgi:hypothetical protein
MRVKTRLYGLLVAAIAGLLLVGMVGVYNAQQQSQFGEQASAITNVVRAQMQSDMMHDAIRGDVLNAIRLVSGKYTPEERKALETELTEHSQTFDKEMEFVAQQKIPEVDTQLDVLRADARRRTWWRPHLWGVRRPMPCGPHLRTSFPSWKKVWESWATPSRRKPLW